MSLVDFGREIGQQMSEAVATVSDAVHLTAEEAQAVIDGAIGDVELGAAKIGKGDVGSFLQSLELPESLEAVSLENIEGFLEDLLEKGKELLNSADSKFGELDAASAGAKTVDNDPEMEKFISTMRQAMVAQLENRQAERSPAKNSSPSL